MRVGIVCPYSFDVAGGVQLHVRDLAEWLIDQGHEVSVLAPADEDTALPPYVVPAGRAVPVRYNGSVARLNFGPVTAARVARWLEDGDLDLVHIHEPVTPSIGTLALWQAECPIVATFHSSQVRSRAMQTVYPAFRPSLEKILARIAVSEDARRTVTTHYGGDAVVIPNGVYVDRFAATAPRPAWQGAPDAPTIAFLGRLGEPRKGLPLLLEALPAVTRAVPGVRLLVAGPGDQEAVRAQVPPGCRVELLGAVSDEDKAALLASADLYVAPNTGGESFGIILVEAMAAGACVLASDLPAFRRVLDGGRAGATFTNESAGALADAVVALLRDPARRAALAARGRERARAFDWSVVAEQVLAVYETVVVGAPEVPAGRMARRWAALGERLRGRGGSTGPGRSTR
ncbi:glycosyltransferase family 4 protein [Arsenicicoccus dermatophilus]|uniref:glycosyltransferase family 4 protein n=1 Tax=Arsenicicoccus dermatophilus TaxID=1076331 RepID=UPI001F4C7C8A|nr:glycosyltransferase family 4 protein [Arsenicicoccus dermatophilus]MCH8613041.1 glycosyltransferase family 4 protein [Arsenicicoccus dermatophilus]